MHFQLLNLVTKHFVGTAAEGPTRWTSGELAAAAAATYTNITGQKHQPRPITEGSNWRERERQRLRDGTYLPVPWSSAMWFRNNYNVEHFLHLSNEKGGFVAFTENDEKGAADRQTRMRAGTYLTRFFSEALSTDDITRIATELAADMEDNEVKFATTADNIEHVYLEGPSSCMSHDDNSYESSIHPVRVYAAGDLAVAYLEKNGTGNITARSVVWPEKKVFTTFYGDEARLKPLLTALGYKKGDLHGARLLKIPEGDGWIAPYVDATGNFDVGDTHLILRNHGRYSCSESEPTGICPSEGCRSSCDCCGVRVDEDDLSTVNTGRHNTEEWCGSCYGNTTYCEDEEIQVRDSDVVQMADGGYWSEWKVDREGAKCDRTKGLYPEDDLSEVTTRSGTESWCGDALDAHATKCDATDDWYSDDAIVELPDGRSVGFDTVEAEEHLATDTDLPTAEHKPSPTMPHPDQIEMEIQF